MLLRKDKILIVGAGNMGFAFLSALLDLSLIHISEPTRPY